MPGHRPALSARLVLVLGGARSGKSLYAQRLAEASGKTPILIATATAGDDEMRSRIARHRADRGGAWHTIEEPLALAAALLREAEPGRIVLVDCLTLWLANVLLAGGEAASATADLVAAIADLPGPAILVSNEVGSGIVPDNAIARTFRDAQGRLNQAAAAACDAVLVVTAGLAQVLKPSVGPTIRFET